MKGVPETRPDDGPVTRVEFTSDFRFETEGRGKGPLFKKGAVYDFPEDLAQRFLRRNVAERVNKSVPVTDKYLVTPAPKRDEESSDEPAPKKPAAKPGAEDGKRETLGFSQKPDPLTTGDFKKS